MRVPKDALGVDLTVAAVARVGSLRVVGSSSVVVTVTSRPRGGRPRVDFREVSFVRAIVGPEDHSKRHHT